METNRRGISVNLSGIVYTRKFHCWGFLTSRQTALRRISCKGNIATKVKHYCRSLSVILLQGSRSLKNLRKPENYIDLYR